MSKEVLLEVKNLKKYFNVGKGKTLKAVDGVSFTINKGETLGLVGESGCGKTQDRNLCLCSSCTSSGTNQLDILCPLSANTTHLSATTILV